MPFEKRHAEIAKKTKPKTGKQLWFRTFVFSVFVFTFGSLYLFSRRGNFDLYIANKVFATTALVLIGLSMALSGLCFFWDFVDTKIIYRKHLGLVGLLYAILHVIVTTTLLPHKFAFPEWIYIHKPSFIFGTIALAIFLIMAIMSRRHIINQLGGKTWRALLSYGGYTAFILVMAHFALLKYNGWIGWFRTREPFLPPLSLLEIIFATAVIILRIALWKKTRKS
jgi:DMSO/TMAO reductase YedYZ heme-binding membrane subunit